MSSRTLTEHKAALIEEGVRDGSLDYLDLLAIAEDFDAWAESSETNVAARCRGEDQS